MSGRDSQPTGLASNPITQERAAQSSFDDDLARLEQIRRGHHSSEYGCEFLLSFIDKLWKEYSLVLDALDGARGETDRACQEYRELNHKYVQDMRAAHETSTEPSVIGAGAGLAPMPTAAEGVDACVRLIQKICAENGFDPAQWLNDETAQSGEKPPCPHCLEAHALIDAEPCDSASGNIADRVGDVIEQLHEAWAELATWRESCTGKHGSQGLCVPDSQVKTTTSRADTDFTSDTGFPDEVP